jgi:hypothetical protein
LSVIIRRIYDFPVPVIINTKKSYTQKFPMQIYIFNFVFYSS